MRLFHFVKPKSRQGNATTKSRQNSAKSEFPSDDLVCPITWDLPLDPVTAEDGRVYERVAIELHFKARGPGRITSPMTNEPMGSQLLPAPQHKNLIESLIGSGVLKGDLAARWNEKVKSQKPMQTLIKKAEKGDIKAMLKLGQSFYYGSDGFQKDFNLAYPWYKKAQEAGNVTATATVGLMLVQGQGVKKCNSHGVFYMVMAAGKGSRFASWQVAMWLAHGWYGMKVNQEEAIRLLLSVVVNGNWAINDMSTERLTRAQELLDELTGVEN